LDVHLVEPAPPKPPKHQRRIQSPLAVLAGIAILGTAPALAAAGLLPSEAQKAAFHVVIVYLTLLAAFRLLGKRELGRLSPFDFVTLMLVPELLSNAVQGESTVVSGLTGLSMLLLLVLVTSVLAYRFQGVERVVEAEPALLVADGRLITHNLHGERIQPSELFSEMHKQGLEDLSQVKWAVLESSGTITFIPKERPPSHGKHDEADDPSG
jgi:uncharacterized membrane protein YcaP (DUF421 family)